MAEHIEDIIDVRDIQQHVRVAMFTYQDHAKEMDKVVEAGGLKDFMTAEAAQRFADEHRNNATNAAELLEKLEDWYYA